MAVVSISLQARKHWVKVVN